MTTYPTDGIRPDNAVRDADRRRTRMWFPDDAPCPSGEYDVRGGLCWPVPTAGGGVVGFAIIIGKHAGDGRYYALRELTWRSIDHVVQEGKIVAQGVAPWLVEVWNTYYISMWYWNGDRALAWRYRKQLQASPATPKMPSLREVRWADEQYPVIVMRNLRDQDRLMVPRESAVFAAEQRWAASPDAPYPPEYQALLTALVAMEQWRMG